MEKLKTQAEVRHEEFLRHAQAARDLANLALANIDKAISENGIVSMTSFTNDHLFELETI